MENAGRSGYCCTLNMWSVPMTAAEWSHINVRGVIKGLVPYRLQGESDKD